MTAYSWPTWADILGNQFSEFENWAAEGSGNTFIFNSLMECIQRGKIKKNDTVIIMWSGVARIDYYRFGNWGHLVSRHVDDIVDVNEPISCPDGYEMLSYSLFFAAEKVLADLGINYITMSFIDYDKTSRAGQIYKKSLENIKYVSDCFDISPKNIPVPTPNIVKNFYNRLAGKDWPTFDKIFNYDSTQVADLVNKEVEEFKILIDKHKNSNYPAEVKENYHPTPLGHLTGLQKSFPWLSIKQDTINWIKDIDRKVWRGDDFYFATTAPIERF